MKYLKFLFSFAIIGIFLLSATATGDDSSSSESSASESTSSKVYSSSWDGSVRQVEKYLKSSLRDPDSYESIEWSELKETSTGYIVRHKYRAKNGFGGYVVANQLFELDSDGNVINVTDF